MPFEAIGLWLIGKAADAGFKILTDRADSSDQARAFGKALSEAIQKARVEAAHSGGHLPPLPQRLSERIDIFFRQLEGALQGGPRDRDEVILRCRVKPDQATRFLEPFTRFFHERPGSVELVDEATSRFSEFAQVHLGITVTEDEQTQARLFLSRFAGHLHAGLCAALPERMELAKLDGI